jgi:CBS-domain-containing membrane protein
MTEHLPVRTRRILAANGSSHESLYVVCPTRMGSADIATCKTCARAQTVSASRVDCQPYVHPQMTPASWAASIAPLSVTCVRENVIADSLRAWALSEPWAIPVVDASSRFIGFVSSNQPVAVATTARLAMAMPAGDMALGASLVVREADSAQQALRVMAHGRARVAAVVDDAGTPRGLLRDIDLLRYLAGQ